VRAVLDLALPLVAMACGVWSLITTRGVMRERDGLRATLRRIQALANHADPDEFPHRVTTREAAVRLIIGEARRALLRGKRAA
jgi:hypothetical protein